MKMRLIVESLVGDFHSAWREIPEKDLEAKENSIIRMNLNKANQRHGKIPSKKRGNLASKWISKKKIALISILKLIYFCLFSSMKKDSIELPYWKHRSIRIEISDIYTRVVRRKR